MNLSDYLQIIRRRGWIVLVAIVLTAGSAFVFSKTQTPLYRSTQKILIQPARNDFGLTQTLVDLLNSYATWMSTNTLAQQVIDQLKLDMTSDQLTTAAKITVDRNNNLLQVDVDLGNGEVANNVARTYTDLFVQWRTEQNAPAQLADRINALPLDAPRYVPIRPTTGPNVAAGALLGLIIGGVIIFVIETLSANVVRRTADVERILELPVLSAIPENFNRSAS
jgi:capsular polysaccharide biosynthesis protein